MQTKNEVYSIRIIGRSREKEGTSIAGYAFTANIKKSRRAKEKSKIPLTVMFDGGIARQTGLSDEGVIDADEE